MRILITGGAGYIGSVVTPALIERGHQVDVVDQLWFGNHLPQAVRVQVDDIANLGEEDLQGYDQVMFLAGLSNDPMAEFDPARNFMENAATPACLAYLSRRAGVRRFIYAGSCSVYGYTNNDLFDETSPTISDSPYSISKLQGEFASLQLTREGFSVIALRQGTVSGFSPRMRLDLIVNTMFKAALSDGRIIVNNPAIWRPILAIQDAVLAYVCAVEAPLDQSGVFNVASENFTIGEVAEQIRDSMREYLGLEPEIEVHNLRDYRNYRVSARRAKDELGFNPTRSIDDIVKELVDNLDEFRDFENDRYYNIRVFRSLTDRAGVPV